MAGAFFGIFIVIALAAAAIVVALLVYQNTLREAKNYERGLKMVPLLIHLPPASEDKKDAGGRDERDVAEEVISQAQVMYNIIASTATRGFKSKIYGQRHLSFEIVASKGVVHYYVVVPTVLVDVISQAIAAAYPSARLQEVEGQNVFSQIGKTSGTIGGEFTLRTEYIYPIATIQESKRDASRAILNALAMAGKEDGVALQMLIRPAADSWAKSATTKAEKIRKDKMSGGKSGVLGSGVAGDMLELLWKSPDAREKEAHNAETRQLSSLEQSQIEAIEEKTRYPGYETLIRVVASSNTAARSQTLLNNVVSVFSQFDSPSSNGFKFALSNNIEELVTAYIFRFFPQSVNKNILNTIELATVFHLPDQNSIPSTKITRQMSKQVDGPTDVSDEGLLLGYNVYRGVKKPIRLNPNDRRRHTYMIGQTGTGKSKFLENLAFQDMAEGRGFAFVDPHGDSAEALLGAIPKNRIDDVVYFNPADLANPIGLNMFEFDSEDQKDFLIQEAINMLYGLYDPGHTGIVGPRLEHIFRNCALLLMSDPQGGTFIDIPKLLVDPEFMKSKLKYVKDQQVLDFWTKEWPNSQRSNEAGEVVSWVVAKFGPFISNTAMRNIIGQTKSGLKIRDVMDNKKILLVNLSKGQLGELNSRLLGIIFVMKFQAAAMGRADTPEDQRQDFSLYVDEFQNFATDSFETILSEARKYRLNLMLANQFMTQLTDEIREAIIGNVGTIVSGRIGITDAELLVKKFQPTFDVEDLKDLPNFQGIASIMINNVPSAPFSMNFVPPMVHPNQKLQDAMRKLSALHNARPRAEVEKEIFARLAAPDANSNSELNLTSATQNRSSDGVQKPDNKKDSFLDEWLMRRQKIKTSPPTSPAAVAASPPKLTHSTDASLPSAIDPVTTTMTASPASNQAQIKSTNESITPEPSQTSSKISVDDQTASDQNQEEINSIEDINKLAPAPKRTAIFSSSKGMRQKDKTSVDNRLNLRKNDTFEDEEVTIKLR